MGFWNDGIRSPSPSPPPSRSRSHSTSQEKHYASRPSYARSASSFFSNLSGSNSRSRSYGSRARPRDGFMAKLRKFIRDLYMYMKKHPVKVFFLVIMPLITGGALTKILAQFGVRLPQGMERALGSQATRQVDERFYARGGARDYSGGTALPGMSGVGLGDSIQGALGIAKMFM